jgi:hypothetical protein
MFEWKSKLRTQTRSLIAALICLAPADILASHEVSYFPSFYPQEIRIERLDPNAAAREFVSETDPLHAYLGAMPRFPDAIPEHLKSIQSLNSFIVVGVNPESARMQDREARCHGLARLSSALAKQPDVVLHPYPVTPYHADYIHHVDLASAPRDAGRGSLPVVRASGEIRSLLPADARTHPTDWDVELHEVAAAELARQAGIAFNVWPAPPWAKEGWFQAYRLLRPSAGQADLRERADAIFDRLTNGEFKDLAEAANLERDLLAALTHGCERAVVGYRLRTEFYNDDFSNGIEHILVDSQSGLNSPVFLRVVKLKDFFWNGWLRLGIETPSTAAWNPVAGFTDAAGRLIWATAADNAFLPIPHNSRWISNRAELRQPDAKGARQSFRIPSDALVPQPRSGKLVAAGSGRGATAKVVYRVLASPFQDETVMEAADLLYPYALAFRWGAGESKDATFDPQIAAATQLMRGRLRGVKVSKMEETSLQVAEMTFTHRSAIVEVYLDSQIADAEANALLAPPWSAVPWHVLALMEAAVERGVAAFSQAEAARRGLPWLDLVRDPSQLAKLRALIKEFAQSGYRPATLEALVGPQSAKSRWQALDKFVEAHGHLLVTNGPYKLKSWSADSATFDVVRDFTYPVGLGTFNALAYPPRAVITGLEQEGDRILIAADVEYLTKQQRSRRAVRVPLRRETLRDTLPIQVVPRYALVGSDGRVAATGSATRQPDGRFLVTLPKLSAGAYTLFAAIFADGNTINPDVGRLSLSVK